jgi:hypothetical protein
LLSLVILPCLPLCFAPPHALLLATPCYLSHLATHHHILLFTFTPWCSPFFSIPFATPLIVVSLPCYLPSCLVALPFMLVGTPSPLSCACGGAWSNNNKLHQIEVNLFFQKNLNFFLYLIFFFLFSFFFVVFY